MSYGIDITTTYEEMLSFLDMTHEKYIRAVQTSIVRPKLFLKWKLCEIRLNNYMKNCLQFWQANHDIQPAIEPYGMVQYVLSYVTKSQKGMSITMDHACKEAQDGNIDIKASVRHIGNAF